MKGVWLRAAGARRLAIVPLLALLALAGQAAASPAAQPGPTGTLLIPRETVPAIVDAGSGEERPIPIEGEGVVASVSWSPDRQYIAVSRATRPPGHVLFGQDIEIFDSAGGAPLVTVLRDRAGVILDTPTWLPNGQALVFERYEFVRLEPAWSIERINADGSERTVVVENGRSPSLAPDGNTLAFVRARGGDALLITDLGGGEARAIVPSGRFLVIGAPRYSPDGSWIAFPSVANPRPEPTRSPRELPRLGAMSAPGRHGFPWDVWLVRPDGSDLRALRLGEDDATLAWSPDGRWLAIYGGNGLGLLEIGAQSPPILIAPAGFGGIDWAP